jgi:Ca2+-dependent lipid-binding protein
MNFLTSNFYAFYLHRWIDLYNKSNDKKVKGQLRYQIQFFPRIDSGVLEAMEATGSEERLDIFTEGIMHLNIIEATDLSIFPGIYPQVLGT